MALRVKHLGGATWSIQATSYSKALRREGHHTPGLRFEASLGAYIGYSDAVAACCKRLEQSGLRLTYIDRPEVDTAFNNTWPIAEKSKSGLLVRPYQAVGANWLVRHAAEGCLLADQLGLGKSVQAVLAARALKHPTLVVVPNLGGAVPLQWREFVADWWPAASALTLQGVKRASEAGLPINWEDPKHPPFLICHYDILHAWAPLLEGRIKTIIFDEIANLVGEKSRRSAAARQLARAASYRMGLNGTPMKNRPKDLWNIADILSEGRFGKPFAFYLKHCAAHQEQVTREKLVWKFDGSSDLEELSERMKYWTLRRTMEEVGLQVPPCTVQVLDVEVPSNFSVNPGVSLKSEAALRKALDLSADGKLPQVIELVNSHKEAGSKTIVFCYRKRVAEMIAEACGGKFIHGDLSSKTRLEIMAEQPSVLACTMDSISVGLNQLRYANVGVFAELHWVPSVLEQCIGRIRRWGQQHNVLIQFLIGLGTSDELIRKSCITKLDLSEKVVGKPGSQLKSDLDTAAKQSGVAHLRKLWESMQEAS